MRFINAFHAVWLAHATITSATGLYAATKGFFQIPPSFLGDEITLFPALHPGHDNNDLTHLLPDVSKELDYSQEGHRSALHGAKHAHFKAKYTRPTVILEHSSHIKSVQCSGQTIKFRFQTPQALETMKSSWMTLDTFNLVTYHVGCSDESSGKRSYFHASQPVIQSTCVMISAVSIEEKEALDSGEISWGTYISPRERKRAPVKGHVRLVQPTDGAAHSNATTVDLTMNPWALKAFFNNSRLNTTHMNDTVHEIEFAPMDGDLSKREVIISDNGPQSTEGGVWDGFKDFVVWYISSNIVKECASAISELVDIGWDMAKVPFGYPFDRTYSEDLKIDETLEGKASTKLPQIFGHENGYQLGSEGKVGTLEQLAFKIKDGITDGTASFINNDPLTIDAVFGITVKGKYSKTWEKEIRTKQPTPVDIPGLLTLGPMVSITAAFTLTVEGEAELILGGSVSVVEGSTQVSLVSRNENGIHDLENVFTPEFQANGTISITGELGVPVTVGLGIDMFDGKFNKTAGVTISPAVYLKSIVSTKKDNACRNGIELRAGVKSPIVLSVFDLWKSDEFLEDPLYERGVTCIMKNGFDPSKTNPATGIIADVVKECNNRDIAKDTPPFIDATANFTHQKGPAGFRIFMTQGKEAILVSGTDGNIYLVNPKAEYDFSAPWATTDNSQNILTMDTFGRALAWGGYPEPFNLAVFELFVADPKEMPRGSHAAGIAELTSPHQDFGRYAVTLDTSTANLRHMLYFPTACLTSSGLRLLATQFMVKQGTNRVTVDDPMGRNLIKKVKTPRQYLERPLEKLGINIDDCLTVQLTSHL